MQRARKHAQPRQPSEQTARYGARRQRRPARVVMPVVADGSNGARLALRRVMMVTWLSIVLGLVMQGIVLASKVHLGGWPPSARIVLDLIQGVTWSFFVCAGVGLGTTIAKSKAYIGGLISLVAAPAAMGIAKGAQKLVGGLIKVADAPTIISLTTLGIVRAVEYGVLGWALAWLVARSEHRWHRFVGVGSAIGIVFGGGVTLATAHFAPASGIELKPQQIVAMGLNEVLFPIGCSLVVFIALVVGRQLRVVSTGNLQG